MRFLYLVFIMLYTEDFSMRHYVGFSQIGSLAKTRHNDAFLEIKIFASVSSIYLQLCSVVLSTLYCKYFSSYKAR